MSQRSQHMRNDPTRQGEPGLYRDTLTGHGPVPRSGAHSVEFSHRSCPSNRGMPNRFELWWRVAH